MKMDYIWVLYKKTILLWVGYDLRWGHDKTPTLKLVKWNKWKQNKWKQISESPLLNCSRRYQLSIARKGRQHVKTNLN